MTPSNRANNVWVIGRKVRESSMQCYWEVLELSGAGGVPWNPKYSGSCLTEWELGAASQSGKSVDCGGGHP